MKKGIFFIIMILIMAVVAIVSVWYLNSDYDKDYFSVLSPEAISSQYIDELIQSGRGTVDENGSAEIPMDGYTIFAEAGKPGYYRLLRVEVTDPKYKFHHGKVGVGDTGDYVRKTYNRNIIDAHDDRFGYRIDNLWVSFYTENDIVKKIVLTYGP